MKILYFSPIIYTTMWQAIYIYLKKFNKIKKERQTYYNSSTVPSMTNTFYLDLTHRIEFYIFRKEKFIAYGITKNNLYPLQIASLNNILKSKKQFCNCVWLYKLKIILTNVNLLLI